MRYEHLDDGRDAAGRRELRNRPYTLAHLFYNRLNNARVFRVVRARSGLSVFAHKLSV